MGKNKKKKAESALYVAPTIEHADWEDAPKRVKVFSISKPNPDGGDPIVIDYDMPGKPNVGLALKMLSMAREYGEMIAMTWLLEEAVGKSGYAALVAEPDLDPADLKGILNFVRRVVLGGLEGPKD